MKLKNTWVILPAWNEEKNIEKVIKDLKEKGFIHLLVIDDGSTDQTAQKAKNLGTTVLSHPVNCGKGAALITGLTYLKNKEIAAFITMDTDGQHSAADALKIIQPIWLNQADCVIGSRLLAGKKDMPFLRRITNQFINFLIRVLYGIKTTDSQSGLRAFRGEFLKQMKLYSVNYNIETETFREISRLKMRFQEKPITCLYTKQSLKTGQSLVDALKTIRSIFLNDLAAT